MTRCARLRSMQVGSCLLVAAVAHAATPAGEEPPVQVTAEVEPQRVGIGEPFRYTIQVTAGPDAEVVIPLLEGQLGDFIVRDFGEEPPVEKDGEVVTEHWYELVTYETGDQLVPGPPIRYRTAGSDLERLDAPDALVIVESLVPEDLSGVEIRDIHGPIAVPRDRGPLLWTVAIVVVALAIIAALLWRLRRRRQAAAIVWERPPHEVALQALVRLRAAGLCEAGRFEEFYVRLSRIVREYLEGRFHLRAPEMTTEEFLQAVQGDTQLTPAQRSSLGDFLREADLVKFARHHPAIEDSERAYAAARGFVEATRPPREEEDRAAA